MGRRRGNNDSTRLHLFSDQWLVTRLGLVNDEERHPPRAYGHCGLKLVAVTPVRFLTFWVAMSLFDFVMCLLPAAALETLRGKGFRHQNQVANAFRTVSEFADFLQCAVSDAPDFCKRCVGVADSEVFLAAVRLTQPTLFEASATALSPCSSTVASCSSGVALALGTQPKRRRTWVPRWPRRPTASCATEELLNNAALLWRDFVVLGDHGSMWLECVTLTDQPQEAYRKLTLERLRTFVGDLAISSCDAHTLAHMVPRRGLHWTSCGIPGGAVAAELAGLLSDIGAGGVDVPSLVGVPSGLRLPHCGSLSEGSKPGSGVPSRPTVLPAVAPGERWLAPALACTASHASRHGALRASSALRHMDRVWISH